MIDFPVHQDGVSWHRTSPTGLGQKGHVTGEALQGRSKSSVNVHPLPNPPSLPPIPCEGGRFERKGSIVDGWPPAQYLSYTFHALGSESRDFLFLSLSVEGRVVLLMEGREGQDGIGEMSCMFNINELTFPSKLNTFYNHTHRGCDYTLDKQSAQAKVISV